MRTFRTVTAASALLAVALSSRAGSESADGVLGRWLAIESADATVSTIELYLEGDALAGRVIRVTGADGQVLNPVCARCSGDLEGKPITGMRFLWGLHPEDGKWTGGSVIDLRDGITQGTVASAELALVDGNVRLHAHLGIRALGQSRTWMPAVAANAPAAPVDAGSEP